MKQRGFTLLELLLAMAIFSLISLTGFTLFKTVFDSDESAQRKLKRLNELQTTFLLMERDFTQIVRRHVREKDQFSKNFIQEGGSNFGVTEPLISFVRAGWTNPSLILPRSELQPVAYSLFENKLIRSHYNYVDIEVGEEPKERVLLDEVEDVHFEYYYDKKWQKELVDKKLPLGIAVELQLKDMGLIRRQFLVAGDQI